MCPGQRKSRNYKACSACKNNDGLWADAFWIFEALKNIVPEILNNHSVKKQVSSCPVMYFRESA